MRFLPREEKFFHFFLDQAKIIVEASRHLMEGAAAGNSQMEAAAESIVKLEQQGDEIIHEMFTRLNQTFITPLDPEDIHKLGSHLDDVLDDIEEAAHRMVSYRLEPIPPAVVELCRIVNACAKTMQSAFEGLNRDEALLTQCIEINRLEGHADHVFRKAMSELFRTEKDPIQLMKHKEVYEILEDTADRCEDVADVLQNVIVKNS